MTRAGSRPVWRRPAFWITIVVFVVAVELRWGPFGPSAPGRSTGGETEDAGPSDGAPTPRDLARLRAAFGADPTDPNAAFELASGLSLLPGGGDEARRLLGDLLERAPGHHEARVVLAELLLDDGRPTEAARELEAALQSAPIGVDWREDAESLLLEAHAAARAADEND